MHLALFHPSVGHQQTVAILLLVAQLAVDKLVREQGGAALQLLVASEKGIDHIDVLVRRAYLHGDGTSIDRKHAAIADVEPLAGVGSGTLVVEREHDELLLQGVGAVGGACSFGMQLVAPALQLGQRRGRIGGRGEPAGDGGTALVLEAIAHTCVHIGPGGIAQVEGQLRGVLDEHLLIKLHAQRRLPVAQGQRQLALMALASLVGDIGSEHEVIEHGMLGLGQHQRHLGRELSLLVGDGLARSHHLLIAGSADGTCLPIARVAHPPEGEPAHHLILHGGSLHGHAGIAARRSLHAEGVAVLIVVGHLRDVHLKRWTLIFLHAEVVILIVDVQTVVARQAFRGQGKLHGGSAEAVGGGRLLAHRLKVGIYQFEAHLLAAHRRVVEAISGGIHDGSGMHRLSRAVDGAVGEDGGLHIIIYLVIVEVIAPHVQAGAELVGIGIGAQHQRFAPILLPCALAFGIAGQHGALDAVASARLHLHLAASDGLARGGIHHHDAALVARQIEGQRAHVADVEQLAAHRRSGLALHLEHIDAHGQRRQGDGVFEQLVGWARIKLLRARQLGQRRQQGFHLIVVFAVVHLPLIFAIGLHAIEPCGDALDVAQLIQLQHLLTLGDRQALVARCAKLGGGHLVETVAQSAHSLPFRPALQGIVQVFPFLLVGGIALQVHKREASDGGFATLRQVLVLADERVEALQEARAFHRLHLRGPVAVYQPQLGQQGGGTVATALVIVAQRAPIAGVHAHHAQQVVVEVAAVAAFHHEGFVVGSLHLRQLGGVGQGLAVVVEAYLLVTVHIEPAVLLVDISQHTVVDGLQGHVVLHLFHPLLQPFHHGAQRVGGDVADGACTLQLSFQQLAVGPLGRSFHHYLAQHLLLGLRQVVALSRRHLLPQAAECLSFHHHGHCSQ